MVMVKRSLFAEGKVFLGIISFGFLVFQEKASDQRKATKRNGFWKKARVLGWGLVGREILPPPHQQNLRFPLLTPAVEGPAAAGGQEVLGAASRWVGSLGRENLHREGNGL